MKLDSVSESVFCIPGAVNIGVIKSGEKAILVDTGLDKDTGRRIFRRLDKLGLKISAIINTHSHADHFGGNNYIVEKSGAKVIAPEIEAGMIQYPYIEPLYLYSAHPVRDLMSRFLMAKPSGVDHVLRSEKHSISIAGKEVNVIPLPGHAPNQIGLEVDGVLFCADTVFSEKIIDKYGIPLFMDIEKQKKTLTKIEKMKCDLFVPSHAEPTEDISSLVDLNLGVIERVEDLILSFNSPKTTEEIFKEVLDYFEITVNNFIEYSLALSTVKAYLSSLYNSGELNAFFDNNVLYWVPD
jgi:glyoxylase-like metal-dependent hydrolase (beta-lactamase superfamily II)